MLLENAFRALFFIEVEFVITYNETGEEKVTKQDNRNNQVKILQLFVL